MRLKMLLDTVMKKLKKERGRVTTLGLTWAKLQGKLSTGLISILSLADKGMWKIRSAVLEIQSQAKATISLHTIQKIKPAEFKWCSTASGFAGLSGQILSYSNGSGSWIGSGAGGRTPYNSGAGAYYTIGSGLNFSNYNTNNTITFNGQYNKPVLVITNDGDVEWHGKPSEAADTLKRTFQFAVEDKKGVTKATRRRYYLRACQNILNKAERMERQEFLDFLRKHVYNKERTVITT